MATSKEAVGCDLLFNIWEIGKLEGKKMFYLNWNYHTALASKKCPLVVETYYP